MDPNGTSAWNAVVRGSKLWYVPTVTLTVLLTACSSCWAAVLGMVRATASESQAVDFLTRGFPVVKITCCASQPGSDSTRTNSAASAACACSLNLRRRVLAPPGKPPPGVHASADGASVVTPVSVVEWFMHFFSPAAAAAGRAAGWQHGVVRAGEVLFVPAGWRHCALNLQPTIAVTHNFVSTANLSRVLRCLRTRDPDLISGCPRGERAVLYGRFCAALAAERPEALAAWRREEDAEARERDATAALARRFRGGADACGAAGAARGAAPAARGFSFAFAL